MSDMAWKLISRSLPLYTALFVLYPVAERHSSIPILRLYSVTRAITLTRPDPTRPDPLRRWNDCGLLGRMTGYVMCALCRSAPGTRESQSSIKMAQLRSDIHLICNCAALKCVHKRNRGMEQKMYTFNPRLREKASTKRSKIHAVAFQCQIRDLSYLWLRNGGFGIQPREC